MNKIYFTLIGLMICVGGCHLGTLGASGQVEQESDSKQEVQEAEMAQLEKEMQQELDQEEETNQANSNVRYATQYNRLNALEREVIIDKGTETRWRGAYTDLKQAGMYICRQCNAPLYRSLDKYDSRSGWPAFDDDIDGAVHREADADGERIEVICKNCGGHLGHVFEGEGHTDKNTRHCVNSISMRFVPEDNPMPATIVLKNPLGEAQPETSIHVPSDGKKSGSRNSGSGDR